MSFISDLISALNAEIDAVKTEADLAVPSKESPAAGVSVTEDVAPAAMSTKQAGVWDVSSVPALPCDRRQIN